MNVTTVDTMPTQEFVLDRLRSLGNTLLKQPYKDMWSESNPSLGYCYVVSEAFYHYGNIEGKLTPQVISFEDGGTHWYLKKEDGTFVDYTADQFPFEIDRSTAKRCPFFKGGVQTPKGFISKRGFQVAQVLGLI